VVDLLTGERDLAGARYTRIQARAELLTSAAKLAYVSGALSLGARDGGSGSLRSGG
jgi:outer membrane protein TolC